MLTYSTIVEQFYHTLRRHLDSCVRYAAARLSHSTNNVASVA